ncbi:MAG: Lrp/AsnC family transcriptional regulator [Meiothermus sp.]|nr:Lrp/AsnC family transcriptional regulator [Meiothermus sp.]
MDKIDSKLLELLQDDSRTSHADLAKAVGLSPTGIHKRLKRLEEQGYVKQFTVVLSRERLGLDLLCILLVTFKTNLAMKNLHSLEKAIAQFPQILECYTLTGAYDAVLKVLVRDHNDLRKFLRDFSDAQNVVERVHTAIVLEELRERSGLPLPVKDEP